MNVNKFYRNPEARRITIKFIIILIIGVVTIVSSSFAIFKYINKKLIDQNCIVLANVLEGKQESEFISNFYEDKSKEEIEEAKQILSSYGYDENISLSGNEIGSEILNTMLMVFIPILILFLVILYLAFIKELRGIYNHIEGIVSNTCKMSDGEYKKIEGDYNEGEMAILISSLNYMGDRVNNSIELLQSDKENLKDFLSDISHQLKTPLASLVMFNDLMRENEKMPYEDRVKFLDESEKQLRRMEWLIMNLLKVGRIEASVIKFENEMQGLEDTIELALSSLREKAKKKNQELIVEGQLDAEICHDKEWLAEALSNIIKNSIEHTKDYGKIEVQVSRGPLITKIYIKDNGVGIPKDMQKKIFKRFYKGENSKNPSSIGIGLSLAKSIIEEMKGEIRLISEEGKGSTFIVSFFN